MLYTNYVITHFKTPFNCGVAVQTILKLILILALILILKLILKLILIFKLILKLILIHRFEGWHEIFSSESVISLLAGSTHLNLFRKSFERFCRTVLFKFFG